MPNLNDIPREVINLALEASSSRNDGWTQKGAKDKLKYIRDYITKVLLGSKG